MDSLRWSLKVSAVLLMAACHTAPAGTTTEVKDVVVAAHPKPGLLPSVATGSPWGGSDPSVWRPEAVYANAISDFVNRAWSQNGVQDVLVAVPVHFLDSGVYPYGDGQSNARIVFNSAWTAKSVPLQAARIQYADRADVQFEVSPDLHLTQNLLEVAYPTSGGLQRMTLPLASGSDGWSRATWQAVPVSETAAFFVRPSPGFDDWFPLTFKHPRASIPAMMATVPASLASFKTDSGVPMPGSLTDPMSFGQKADDQSLPFDLAYDLAKQHKWPKAFIPQDKPYYPSCNVHGTYTKDDQPHDPTAVGRNWTWVATPTGGYPGAETVPFKILYTCFEERRLHHPTANDPDCDDSTRHAEFEDGVPSGGGWHKIGDPAETLFNSLERVPLLVASGFERPAERTGALPPSGGYAFGLSDVAIARWLWPGEAFMTANTQKNATGDEFKNFHWFLFHTDRETCTVEWVHPRRPDDSGAAQF